MPPPSEELRGWHQPLRPFPCYPPLCKMPKTGKNTNLVIRYKVVLISSFGTVKNFFQLKVYEGLYLSWVDIYFTAQRNFSRFEGVGCQEPREKVTLEIMIAKVTSFSPFVRGKNFFPQSKFIKALIFRVRIYISELKEIFQNLRVMGAKNLKKT